MIPSHRVARIVTGVVIAGHLLTGTALGATERPVSPAPCTSAPAKLDPYTLDQAVKAGKLSQGEADVLKQIVESRTAVVKKLQSESEAIIAEAVKEGKITQEQAEKLRRHESAASLKWKGLVPRKISPKDLKRMLEVEVKAGKLSQGCADEILKRLAEQQQSKRS